MTLTISGSSAELLRGSGVPSLSRLVLRNVPRRPQGVHRGGTAVPHTRPASCRRAGSQHQALAPLSFNIGTGVPMLAPISELPWNVRLTEHPRPESPLTTRTDVVQTGLCVGMRALDELRKLRRPVGPVLCCMTDLLVHIPVEAGSAWRWHAPQAPCRYGDFSCLVPGREWQLRECVRIWLLPHDSSFAVTDSAELHHSLASVRAAWARAA